MRKYIAAFTLLILYYSVAMGHDEPSIKIIVNRANPIAQLTRKQVSELFLKKVTIWKNQVSVSPVDLKFDSVIRNEFSSRIHRKSPSIIKTYWQQQIFSGNEVPPIEKATETEILEFVASEPGGIGYVSNSVTLTDQIKVITVTNLESK